MSIYADKKHGRPTGSWVVEVQVGGKKIRKRFQSFQMADQAEKDHKSGKTPLGQVSGSPEPAGSSEGRGAPKTLSAALDVLEGLLWAGLKTQAEQVERCRRIIRWTGDQPLAGCDQTWADRVAKTLLARSDAVAGANRNLSALVPLLEAVQARGWLRTVPTFERPEENEGRIRVLSAVEETQLLAELRLAGFPLVATLVEVALDTGMRRGELLGIDRTGLRQAANGGWWFDLDDTKSGSPRSVPLTPRALAGIRQLLLAGIPPVHTIRYAWDKAQLAMKLDTDQDFTLHACRHTCATRLLERGENTRVIQKWLGHKRLETTERYAHVFDATLENAASKLA